MLTFKSEAEFKRFQKSVKAHGGKLRIVGGIDTPNEPQPAAVKPRHRIAATIAPMLAPSKRQLWHTRLLARFISYMIIAAFPYGFVMLIAWFWLIR